MSDALISPSVGGVCWIAALSLLGIGTAKLRRDAGIGAAARMGLMGAFVFASQMINFAIPGTGSSGHLGGGLLLAVVLGPWAGFIAMSAVLLVQALLFADGGLLAWGANVCNLGFFTALVACPILFRPLAGDLRSRWRVVLASVVAAVAGLQLGALGVVLETVLSGISALPFKTFLLLMQPIHLLIGLVEGGVTAGILLFLAQVSPAHLAMSHGRDRAPRANRRAWVGVTCAAVLGAGVFSWFASQKPDGLEWAIGKTTGGVELAAPENGVHRWLSWVQARSAIFPDYSLKSSDKTSLSGQREKPTAQWPRADWASSLAGLTGTVVVCLLTTVWIWLLKRFKRRGV